MTVTRLKAHFRQTFQQSLIIKHILKGIRRKEVRIFQYMLFVKVIRVEVFSFQLAYTWSACWNKTILIIITAPSLFRTDNIVEESIEITSKISTKVQHTKHNVFALFMSAVFLQFYKNIIEKEMCRVYIFLKG